MGAFGLWNGSAPAKARKAIEYGHVWILEYFLEKRIVSLPHVLSIENLALKGDFVHMLLWLERKGYVFGDNSRTFKNMERAALHRHEKCLSFFQSRTDRSETETLSEESWSDSS